MCRFLIGGGTHALGEGRGVQYTPITRSHFRTDQAWPIQLGRSSISSFDNSLAIPSPFEV
ncbi:unnamed protein product, partial [Vitis vinifera]